MKAKTVAQLFVVCGLVFGSLCVTLAQTPDEIVVQPNSNPARSAHYLSGFFAVPDGDQLMLDSFDPISWGSSHGDRVRDRHLRPSRRSATSGFGVRCRPT